MHQARKPPKDKKRNKKSKRAKATAGTAAHEFDFKSYFDRFLRKEPKVKKLMQTEVAAIAGGQQIAPQRPERSPSQVPPSGQRRY